MGDQGQPQGPILRQELRLVWYELEIDGSTNQDELQRWLVSPRENPRQYKSIFGFTNTSKEGLFNRGVLIISYESILRSMCPSEKALEVRASVERSESFALGKRYAVPKLTTSLSPRAKLRPRLLVTSGHLFRHPRSKSAPAKIS